MRNWEWTLLVIAAAEGGYLTPVKLQKTLFLVGQTVPSIDRKSFYTFKPYNYGPFCKDIYLDAENLAADGLVRVVPVAGQSWANYEITEGGVKKAKELQIHLDNSHVEYLHGLVRWIKGLTFKQLLSHVYEKYPDYAVKSMLSIK